MVEVLVNPKTRMVDVLVNPKNRMVEVLVNPKPGWLTSSSTTLIVLFRYYEKRNNEITRLQVERHPAVLSGLGS